MTVIKPEYLGLTYERASRKAAELIDRHKADWHTIVDDLVQLREVMLFERRRLSTRFPRPSSGTDTLA